MGQWSTWGACSPLCNGNKMRKRECLFGDCEGPFMETQTCNCGNEIFNSKSYYEVILKQVIIAAY